jgi:hypothetical protein
VSQAISDLFSAARERGGIEFIYTLLRVEGMSLGVVDPFEVLRETLRSSTADDDYCLLATNEEPLKLLANLLRCAAGERFDPFIGEGPQTARVDALVASASHAGHEVLASDLRTAYAELKSCGGASESGAPSTEAADSLLQLLRDLLDVYDNERRSFINQPRLHKMPGFDVLELLVDDDVGLFGFRIHFSNSEHAEFRRTRTETLPLNLTLDDGVVLFVGNTDELASEWRVGDKPLYEMGLPGRYNRPGEWKPLVFPADWEPYMKKAREQSDRSEVQGALFYMFVTGHHAIEFVVRTNLELPHELVSFGAGRVELQRVALSEPSNELMYDGTIFGPSPNADAIEEALDGLQALLNRLAYAFDAAIDWVPKYDVVIRTRGRPAPTDGDLALLDRLLAVADAPGQAAINEAIDWYNRGRTATNEFVAFLCTYIAFERLATAIWQGDLAGPHSLRIPTRAQRRAETRDCIIALHDALYADDPARFVREAYFECVVGLTKQVRQVATSLFGADSRHVALLYEERDGYSLAKLRSDLAHGRISIGDRSARHVVRERLADIQEVARAFLLRAALGLEPAEELPSWSQNHQLSIAFVDPRSTLCTTSLEHLPASDWLIRPEWVV